MLLNKNNVMFIALVAYKRRINKNMEYYLHMGK
jgi:hypothetical protein